MKAIFPALALAFAAAAIPLRAQAVDTVAIDSAQRASIVHLRREFRARMIAHGIADPDALLLVSGTQSGAPVQVRVLEGTVPPGVLAALDTMIQAMPARPGSRVESLLRPEEDTEPGFDSSGTPPDARNTGQISRALNRFMRDHPEVGVPGQLFQGAVRMVLTRNGNIPYAQVERSTGSVRVDEGVMAAVKKIRIRPAMSNGKPVDMWVIVPVMLEVPPEAPPPTGNAPRPE